MAVSAVGAIVGAAVETTVTTGILGVMGAAGVVGTTSGVLMASGIISAGIGSVVGGMIGTPINNALFGGGKPAPSAVGAQQARGMLINAASSIDPLQVVYGSRRVGGTYVVPPFVSGASNQYLHLVIALCEGEISAINTVYLDGVASSDARYTGLVTIEKFTGSDTQAASPLLLTDLPGWTSAHQGKGVAYLHVKLLYNQNAFHGIPVVTADIDGKLVYDPDTATTIFSNDPALCIRDYLTSTRYGRGIDSTLIDDASFIAAASHCAELVSIPGGATQARYTCDGVVNVDDTAYANMQRLLGSCRGMLVFSGGQYRLVIDKAETPSAFTFDEDNITGAWEIIRPGKRDKANKVTAAYFNPANDWQPDFAIQESATYLAADRGLVLERKIDAPFTANHYRAAHLAQLEMKSTRFGTVARFSAFQEGLRCEVGDVVPVTHSTPGWTAKPFRILTIDILDSDNVMITAREYDDAAYTLDALDAVATAPQTALPDPFTIAAPTGLTLTSGTTELLVAGDGTIISRIKAAFTPPSDAFLKRCEVQWKKTTDSIWQVAPADDTATAVWLAPVDDGVAYDVRVRAESVMARSSWATAAAHTVVGKTELPADVTGFSAAQNGNVVVYRWKFSNEVDLAGAEIRYVAKGGAWADATAVTKVTRGTQITTAAVPPGDWTHMIKARDTSGNYSLNAASFDLVVTNTYNLIYQENEAPVWSGTLTGLVKHWTGVLVPQSQNLASDDDWDTFDVLVPNPVTTCTYEHTEAALGFDSTLRVWFDMDARIPPTGTGTAEGQPQIDYHTASGAYDGFEDWSVGQIVASHVKMKLVIDTASGTPVLHGFTPTLDTQELVQRGSGTASASGGTITFPQQYHSAPTVGATYSGASARFAAVHNITATGADVHIYDTTGAEVGGDFTWDSSGA